jgi:hypothetical protein
MQGEDPNRINSRNSEKRTVSKLSISLQVETEKRMNLTDRSHWKIEISDDIMRKFDSQNREETFLNTMNE